MLKFLWAVVAVNSITYNLGWGITASQVVYAKLVHGPKPASLESANRASVGL